MPRTITLAAALLSGCYTHDTHEPDDYGDEPWYLIDQGCSPTTSTCDEVCADYELPCAGRIDYSDDVACWYGDSGAPRHDESACAEKVPVFAACVCLIE